MENPRQPFGTAVDNFIFETQFVENTRIVHSFQTAFSSIDLKAAAKAV